jgi:Ca-activated chloride channel family protein
MTFEAPWAFALLLFAVLFSERGRGKFGRLLLRGEESEGVPFLFSSSFSEIRRISEQYSWKVRYGEILLTGLKVAGWVLLVVALARPQRIETLSEAEMTGRDIMLTLDLSGSMQALDFILDSQQVDRLTALKEVTLKFVDSRQGDRLAIVVFGDKVFLQCPLTTDIGAVERYIRDLEIGMAGAGTALGDALVVSLKRIKDIPEHSKVIILVTDGKNTAGDIIPKDAAELARSAGVKVHVIGIGGPEPAPFPVRDMFGMKHLVKRPMDYDEPTLKLIAETTGGRVFNAKNTDQLQEVFADIDQLEKRVSKTYESSRVTEFFFIPLIAGSLSLALAQILSLSVLRRGDA